MKEIIYLDTDQMNSMLAQLQKGLITNFALEENSQESETEGQQTTRGKKAGVNGQVAVDTGLLPGGSLRLGASLGNDGQESTNHTKTILEGQKDILNKAFHDYALDILIKNLTETERLTETDQLTEGDISLVTAPYKYYDFDLIKNLIDLETMKQIMNFGITEAEIAEAKKILKKSPKSVDKVKLKRAREIVTKLQSTDDAVNGLRAFELIAKYFSNSLGDISLIKAENFLGIIRRNFLREIPEALSFRTDQGREVKILMRVISIKEHVKNENHFYDNPFNPNDLDTIPNYMFETMLGSFGIMKKGDVLVKPIAIYYE